MICTVCWGKGWTRGDGGEKVTCPACGGSGKVEQTNEEYIRQASTEELAKEIANHIFVSCTTNKAYSNPLYAMVLHDVVEWLKQPHTPKE